MALLFGFSACGGGSNTTSQATDLNSNSKYSIRYKGLLYFAKEMPKSSYKLSSLDDASFNALNENEKLLVADKLLSTLFFAYPLSTIKEKIASGHFISAVENGLKEKKNDVSAIEAKIIDTEKFYRPSGQKEVLDILSRFYVANKLDKYFFDNWVAYILTQTIMFSPAYELGSSHSPDVASVYNRLVTLVDDNSSMRFITYMHMSSEDNWRRFRSPEDNGREMLEIFTFDKKDSDVPLSATALQNWKLDRDNDTLVVGLNENTKPLSLFGTTIYNGDDFYREMVKSKVFIHGVVKRLVEFFFISDTPSKIDTITDTIVASKPKTWQGILKQIIFSKEYLLHTARAKSAEEEFFSLAKKIDFQTSYYTIFHLKNALENMHQAAMKYKLGKLERVPLDTLSFANYSKFMRDEVLMRYSNPKEAGDYKKWSHQGWSDSFLSDDKFESVVNNPIASLNNFINYLFQVIIARDALPEEIAMFDSLMIEDSDGVKNIVGYFDILDYHLNSKGVKKGEGNKRNVALVVLDYISRLQNIYLYKKVN